jgi:hypothetical protein
MTVEIGNDGNKSISIKSVELIDYDEWTNNEQIVKENIYGFDTDTTVGIRDYARYHSIDLMHFHMSMFDNEFKGEPIELNDFGKLSEYISYKIDSIDDTGANFNNLRSIKIKFSITRLKETKNQAVGKLCILKMTETDGKVIFL